MNEKLEEYINDLPEELKQKARECKTPEEFNKFIINNDLELPEEALEMVAAGGCSTTSAKKALNNDLPKPPTFFD